MGVLISILISASVITVAYAVWVLWRYGLGSVVRLTEADLR